MPVVRELVNRISFKVNPGDVKDVESTFKKISKLGLATITGITVASTKLFTDFEKNTGASKFFSKNKEEAEALLKVVDEIAAKSENTSRREARQASETLSQLNIRRRTLEEFIPFIEKISIAQPKLDFTQVSESLNRIIKGGDIQELINLVPGIKQQLELLSKTTFGKPFGDILEENRAKLVLDALRENQGRLTELLNEQEQTLNNAFVRVGKDASDFTLKFGEKTAPAIKEALGAVESLIEELNESKGLWDAIDSTVSGISKLIKGTADLIKEINQKGVSGIVSEKLEETPAATQTFAGVRPGIQQEAPTEEGKKNIQQHIIELNEKARERDANFFKPLIDFLQSGEKGGIKQEGLRPGVSRTVNVVISGSVESNNNDVKQALNDIIAETGGLPATQ
jgi:hypothetical protein